MLFIIMERFVWTLHIDFSDSKVTDSISYYRKLASQSHQPDLGPMLLGLSDILTPKFKAADLDFQIVTETRAQLNYPWHIPCLSLAD